MAVEEEDVAAEAVISMPGFPCRSDGMLSGVFDEDCRRGSVGD